MTIQQHIRLPLSPKGANQWYRSRVIRTALTYCGAPVTEYDIACGDKAVTWKNFVPCDHCIGARARNKQQPQPGGKSGQGPKEKLL